MLDYLPKHCSCCITDPRLSREPNASTDSIMPYLLFEGADDKGICPDFLTEIVSRFDEDDTVKPMLTKAVVRLSEDLAKLNMNDNYKPHVNVSYEEISTLVSH